MKPRWTFAPALALSVTLAAGAFSLLVAVLGLTADQTQELKWGAYVSAFLIILPAALAAGTRLAERLATRVGPRGAMAASALLAGGLAAGLLLTRLVVDVEPGGAGSAGLVLVTTVTWALGAVVFVTVALRPAPPRWMDALLASSAVTTVAAMVFAALALAFVRTSSLDTVPLVVSLAVAAVGVAVAVRVPAPGLPRGAGAAIDVAVVVIVLLAIPDVVLYATGGAGLPGAPPSEDYLLWIHHNFFVGPANDVLGGRAMLVDSAAQYGVGSIYALAATFEIAPIGYGTLGLLTGAATALLYAISYALLRVCGCPRPLAATAIAIAVVATVYSAFGAPGVFPNIGPLRFGLPLVLVLVAAAAARWPRRSGWLHAGSLLVLGLAAIWSIETFVYTTVTFGVIRAFEAAVEQGTWRRRMLVLGRSAIEAIAVCVAAQVVLAIATFAAAGQLPDYGGYAAFFDDYSVGQLGESVGLEIAPWSPAFGVGAAYLASAAALALLALRRVELVQARRSALTAIAGLTAYGTITMTYFVGRSGGPLLASVALPAILLAPLWLRTLDDPASRAGPWVRLAALCIYAWLAALLVASSWDATRARFGDTALAYAVPGDSRPLGSSLDRLWSSPPLDPRSVEGEELLASHMPGPGPALVLVEPDLTTEILVRSERPNLLPVSHWRQEDINRRHAAPAVEDAIERLEPGTPMLIEAAAIDAPLPPPTVLSQPVPLGFGDSQFRALVPLEQWALGLIKARFELEPVASSPSGLTVVRLQPR